MRIQIDPHTLERSEERGATEEEIQDVIETGLAILQGTEEQEKQRSMSSKKSGMVYIMNRKGLKCFI